MMMMMMMRSGLLAGIRWSVCMLKSHKSLCKSFSMADVGLCIYHLFVWSTWNFLHISQWTTLPTQSCLTLLLLWLLINQLMTKFKQNTHKQLNDLIYKKIHVLPGVYFSLKPPIHLLLPVQWNTFRTYLIVKSLVDWFDGWVIVWLVLSDRLSIRKGNMLIIQKTGSLALALSLYIYEVLKQNSSIIINNKINFSFLKIDNILRR